MKLLRIGAQGAERPAVSSDGITAYDLSSVLAASGDDLISVEGLRVAQRALAEPGMFPEIDLRSSRIGAPLAQPGKIVCVGLNYRRHAAEAGMSVPEEPVLFMKAPYTMHGPNDDVVFPPRSVKTDYEVELAIVIGTTARYLRSPDTALEHVLGYAISNDVSERAFQLERGGQWDKGKNCETFNPFGPWIATRDEVADPQALRLELSVNGEQRQSSSTADMIFDVAHIVWYVSQFMTLLRGDVINTGTPEGVGSGFEPGRFLNDGDVVDGAISGLGAQRQRFVDFSGPGAALTGEASEVRA